MASCSSSVTPSSATFLDSNNFTTDKCAKEAKDVQNRDLYNYDMWNYRVVPCPQSLSKTTETMRSPDCQYDHVNLRANIGYGLTDECTVDTYSSLRNGNKEQLTRDKCHQQLFTRMFFNVPCLKPGVYNSDQEMPLWEGMDTQLLEGVTLPCKRQLSEKMYDRFTPFVPCLKNTVQNANYIVPAAPACGQDTRESMRQSEFIAQCGIR